MKHLEVTPKTTAQEETTSHDKLYKLQEPAQLQSLPQPALFSLLHQELDFATSGMHHHGSHHHQRLGTCVPSTPANMAASPKPASSLAPICSKARMDASDGWSRVTGLHPSPRAGGSVASDFLTGKTEEEFPQIHKDTGQH